MNVSRVINGLSAASCAYNLFDRGLANFLALDTLRHGTSPLSYLSILFTGADPKRGGSQEAAFTGSSLLRRQCRNYFYLMPDPDFPRLFDLISRVTGPPRFIRMATWNMFGLKAEDMDWSSASFFNRLKLIALEIIAASTPVLRFKFRPEEACNGLLNLLSHRFIGDPGWPGISVRTKHRISPLRLGIVGSLMQGIGTGMFQRMANKPLKVLSGIGFMGLGAYMAKRAYNYLTESPKEETNSSNKKPSLLGRVLSLPGWALNKVNQVYERTIPERVRGVAEVATAVVWAEVCHSVVSLF